MRGSLLKTEIENCVAHFGHWLFGVCEGKIETRYLVVLGEKKVNHTEYAEVIHEMEMECAKSDVFPFILGC